MIAKQKTADDVLARKQAAQKKSDEREAWFKAVVKIIVWKDGVNDGNNLEENNKITPQEWLTYCDGLFKISLSSGREKTVQKIEEIKQIIKSHNGFF